MDLQDDKNLVMHSNKDRNKAFEPSSGELSDIWSKLLTPRLAEVEASDDMPPGSLADDPWSELLHVKGVEIVDLQHLSLQEGQISLSELELEQILQIMQEQPVEGKSQG